MAATLDLGNLLVHMKMDASQYMNAMRSVEARMRKTSQRLISIGRSMSMYITAPIVAMGGASVKAFASFDDAMTKSLAIMSGITPQLRKEMEDLALEISNKGVVSAKDLARSYFYLASAGLDARQSMAALKTVEEFAVAGAFDMALATDLATDAQSALGLTVKNAQQNMINMTRVTDVLTGANTLANASTQQFSEALTSQAGPAMKAYGVELEEGVAVLAAYADQGIKAQHAGNMMSRMLRLMIKGFMDSRGAWERFNIDIFTATGELKPLYTIIGDLSRVLNRMSTEQKNATLSMLGFQARSQQAILPLLGLQDRIKEYNDELLKMGGITKKIAERQLKSFSSQMKILWNQIKNTAIEIGARMAPSILSLNEKIRKAISYWNLMEDSVKRNILIFAGVAAAIGPVLLATGLLLKSLTFMIATVGTLASSFAGLTAAVFGPIGVVLLLAAIAYALRAAWKQNLKAIKDRMQELFDSFKVGFDWLRGTILVRFLVWFGEEFQSTFSYVKSEFGTFLNDIAGMWHGSVTWLKKMSEGVVAAMQAPTFYQMIDDFKKGWEKAGNAFAFSFVEGSDRATNALEAFKKSVREGYETTGAYLKGFGEATVEHLSELLDAVKIQFGQDADALIALIKSKMLKVETPLGLTPADVAELDAEMKKLRGTLDDVGERIDRMKTPMEEWADNARDVATRVGEAFANAFERMGDELADFLVEGKANFKDFAKSILKDLLAIYMRAQIVMPLAMALGFIPTSTNAPGSSTPGSSTFTSGGVSTTHFHKGGLVGAGGMPQRMVPAATFIGAPRLHGGLAPDEFPSILQRGETVIPRGGGAAPTIIINNNTGQPLKQEGTPSFNGKEWVIGIVTENINQYGVLRQTIGGINR